MKRNNPRVSVIKKKLSSTNSPIQARSRPFFKLNADKSDDNPHANENPPHVPTCRCYQSTITCALKYGTFCADSQPNQRNKVRSDSSSPPAVLLAKALFNCTRYCSHFIMYAWIFTYQRCCYFIFLIFLLFSAMRVLLLFSDKNYHKKYFKNTYMRWKIPRNST